MALVLATAVTSGWQRPQAVQLLSQEASRTTLSAGEAGSRFLATPLPYHTPWGRGSGVTAVVCQDGRAT